jgi:hypothetical protein
MDGPEMRVKKAILGRPVEPAPYERTFSRYLSACRKSANERHWRQVADCRTQNPTPTPPLQARSKLLSLIRGAFSVGIVLTLFFGRPVEVDIDDAAIGFMRKANWATLRG